MVSNLIELVQIWAVLQVFSEACSVNLMRWLASVFMTATSPWLVTMAYMQVVDMVMLDTYAETDMDQDPVFVLKCGHIFTWGTLDGHMALQDAYDIDAEGAVLPYHDPQPPLAIVFVCPC